MSHSGERGVKSGVRLILYFQVSEGKFSLPEVIKNGFQKVDFFKHFPNSQTHGHSLL